MMLMVLACWFAGPADIDGPQPMAVEELVQMESRDSVALEPTRAGMCVGWEVIWVPALLVGIVVAGILLI